MDKTLYTLIVHSENFAGLLNQVTAVFTRRQINNTNHFRRICTILALRIKRETAHEVRGTSACADRSGA